MPPLYYLFAPRIFYAIRRLLAPIIRLLARPIVLRVLQVAQRLSWLMLVFAIGYYLFATFGASWSNLPLSAPLPSLLPWVSRLRSLLVSLLF